ncbi:glycosyltransferase family 4 protein [Haematospirillum sp. H1815]|uniref:MraY family glycosyltransferase n=1 Tax=Haematospirillum sp. H1815 TaxID=2723108 RepID=UPI002AC318F7|nr:glycosyltransferase family 4 protein [Haematospirillum sp. H1815]
MPTYPDLTAILLGLGSLAFSIAGTRLVLFWLKTKAVLDMPNERSSHTEPTPRGGGLAVTLVVIAGWTASLILFPGNPPVAAWITLAMALVLYGLSWIDDRINLKRRLRFPIHVIAVTSATLSLPDHVLVLQGEVPLWADRIVTVISWVWFLNLYNFMDGIDGITGMQTGSIGLGIVIVSGIAGLNSNIPWASMGMTLIGASIGFLLFNWHPARLFLGDVGSIPLGFLTGFLLLMLAGTGYLAAALIIPAYYLVDATVTLLRRIATARPIAQAHREHFYQVAVHRSGLSHSTVTLYIMSGNMALLAATIVSVTLGPAAGIIFACIPILFLLFRFTRRTLV